MEKIKEITISLHFGSSSDIVFEQMQMLEELKILVSKDISDLEDAYLAELVTDLQSKLTSQEASQKAFINITKLNLFDYIS